MTEGEKEEEARETALGRDLNAFRHFFLLAVEDGLEGWDRRRGREGGREGWMERGKVYTHVP